MKESLIAILQPLYPHYRDEFFKKLSSQINEVSLYSYQKESKTYRQGFNTNIKSEHIPCMEIGRVLFYNPFTLLKPQYDILVLMLNFAHITTWLLLLTKFLHRKKIILWGQGISVKRYLIEEKHPDWKLKWMIMLADGAWIYMDKECEQWRRVFPSKPIISLGNSLSGITDMLNFRPTDTIDIIKQKYNIKQTNIYIFCARFENQYRRIDILEEIIKKLDPQKNGFIIIGAGKFKPDFTKYSNVYDFGAIYDIPIKQELFYISDLYLQPGWVGLSIVEAMAYGKPICTFKRTRDTLQCVEYSYIEDGINGMIFNDLEDCLSRLEHLNKSDIIRMGTNARKTAMKYTPEKMVENALKIF